MESYITRDLVKLKTNQNQATTQGQASKERRRRRRRDKSRVKKIILIPTVNSSSEVKR